MSFREVLDLSELEFTHPFNQEMIYYFPRHELESWVENTQTVRDTGYVNEEQV